MTRLTVSVVTVTLLIVIVALLFVMSISVSVLLPGLIAQSALEPPAENVVLELVGGLTGGCGPGLLEFIRVLPDGRSSGVFRVNSGKVLEVTDVDWQYAGGNPGEIQILRLFVENLADPSFSRREFESTITLGSAGQGGTSESMTTGFLVSEEARICPDVSPGPMGPPGGLQHIILRGLLRPAG